MGIDQNEGRRRSKVDRKERGKLYPYFRLEHRLIESPAWAALSFSARALLDLFGRQLNGTNNGHLQATFAWAERYGFGSEHTLRAAIADLITHGFIYKTRSHGANGAWARYAVTWEPIKNTADLFLAGFVPNVWEKWAPEPMANGKSSRQKLPEQSSRKCSFTPKVPAETAGKPTAESADYESCCHGIRATNRVRPKIDWIAAELARLASVGLAGHQCFQIPPARSIQ